jgi:hypothetical protein
MFKWNGIPRVLLAMVLGIMLSTLIGRDQSQFTSDQGTREAWKLAQRAWWVPLFPPKK